MKIFITAVFVCLLSSSFCWDYPGYPGVDCPTAREKMMTDPDVIGQWMIPKCHTDGTFSDLQCYKKHPDVCMCVAPDGSPLTLPGFGRVTTCVCFMDQYQIFEHDPNAEMLNCAHDGSYEPLQCSKQSGKCWCVDRNGKVRVPPSKDIHSC